MKDGDILVNIRQLLCITRNFCSSNDERGLNYFMEHNSKHYYWGLVPGTLINRRQKGGRSIRTATYARLHLEGQHSENRNNKKSGEKLGQLIVCE
jgi:hypothetical protein